MEVNLSMGKELKINLEQNTGTVIYFVEGGSTEFTLLKTVFGKILHYDYVEKKRGKPAKFINNRCVHSRVYVINTSESNISDISDVDYLDKVYEYLINEYGLDLDNAAKFYLFDRDNQSNTDTRLISKYLNILSEPYGDDTEFEKGGLLLLSYPAIESFVLSNFLEDTYQLMFKLGSDVKTFMGLEQNQRIVQFNKINSDTLTFATNEFFKYIEFIESNLDLDNIAELNKKIFEMEEADFAQSEMYRAVSGVVLSLLYLGIIRVIEMTDGG